MATINVVTGDQYRIIDRRMREIKRQLDQDGGSPLDPNWVARGLQQIIEQNVTASPFFPDDEKIKFNYHSYPLEYIVKPVVEQLLALSRRFPSLDPSLALNYSKELPILPQGAEGWFAVPKFYKVGKTYNEVVERMLNIIGKTNIYNYFHGNHLSEKHLRLSERTAVALKMLGEKQKGDFLLIAGQFGFLHRGRSVQRTRVVYAPNEFGLGSFIVGCILISHPERLIPCKRLLNINCSGDEYSPTANGNFSSSPCFFFNGDDLGGRVAFNHHFDDCAYGHYGTASAFLPQPVCLPVGG